MNQKALLHKSDSKFCFPTGEKSLVLRLQTDKDDIFDKVEVIYANKYTIYHGQEKSEMEIKYTDSLYNTYEIELHLEDVRLAYVFCIWMDNTPHYYSEDGITMDYDFKLSYYSSFQMPYIHNSDLHTVVPWMENAVFYQIFIDRFYEADKEKDRSYLNLPWGDIPNSKSFAGGDLKGIIEKLDYINDLGANALYLTPVFCAISNHKYDISDYLNIDPHFGSNKIFAELVKEAHNKGMKIVLDAVFNHCSMLIPQFQDVLKNGRQSKYFDWFIIDGDYPDLDDLNYRVFAFCNYMPKFNTSNPEVEEYLLNVARHWIKEYDIDGWRLDVSDEVSHDFWRKFRDAVKSVKPDCVIIGENWHDANSYLKGDQFDSIMNYAFTKTCLDYYAFENLDTEGFAHKLNHLLTRNTNQVNAMMLNLLDTHDTDRFYTRINKNKDKLISAIAVMTVYPGAPSMYYGTEIALEGGHDPDNRRCFDWDEDKWDNDLMDKIRTIFSLKQKEILQKGDVKIYAKEDLCYINRILDNEELHLILNQSKKTIPLELEGEVLVSNNYSSNKLLDNGFVIIRKERN